jgi:hypothetical protein
LKHKNISDLKTIKFIKCGDPIKLKFEKVKNWKSSKYIKINFLKSKKLNSGKKV